MGYTGLSVWAGLNSEERCFEETSRLTVFRIGYLCVWLSAVRGSLDAGSYIHELARRV